MNHEEEKRDIFSICLRLQMSSQAFQGLAQCVFVVYY